MTVPARRMPAVDLRCVPGGAPDARLAMGAWGALGEALWPAWSTMDDAELSVYESLGEDVAEKLLVLWAISRFRESDASAPALAELVDEQGRPRFGDPVVEDMMLAAFALGASWQASRAERAECRPRLHVAAPPA